MNPIPYCEKHALNKDYKNKSYVCKLCKFESKKTYIANNKDKVAIATKIYNAKKRLERQQWTKEDRLNNPQKYKDYAAKGSLKNASEMAIKKVLRKYKLTREQYIKMIEECGNKCRICNQAETRNLGRNNKLTKLSVDHCHKTKKVRGLLCHKCNIGIGNFNDNSEILQNAIKYLQKHHKEQA